MSKTPLLQLPRSDGFGAIILAGGESRRMGRDKALLPTDITGITLVERVVKQVREAGPQDIYIIANRHASFEFLNLPIIKDEIPGVGPIIGIISGLTASRCERNLVVACDMPLLEPALLTYLVSLSDGYDAVVPGATADSTRSHVEPLHAVYAKSALPGLRAAVENGFFALHEALDFIHVRYVGKAEISHISGDVAASFTNWNRPEDIINATSDFMRR